MRSMGIGVCLVLGQDRLGARGVEDQDPVEQLAVAAAHESLADRVRTGRPDRDLDDTRASAGKDGIEGGGGLGVPIPDQEPDPAAGVVQAHQQVAGLLGHPRPGRMRCDTEDPDPARVVLDHEEHVQPLEGDGLDVEEVAGHDALGLGCQELLPGRARPSRRWVQSRGVEDRPPRRGRDLVAEDGELTVHPAIAPRRVLPGEACHQRPKTRPRRRPSRPRPASGPAAGHQTTVHRRIVPGVTSIPIRRAGGSATPAQRSRPGPPTTAAAAAPDGRNTSNWWRSPRITASLDASDRASNPSQLTRRRATRYPRRRPIARS